MSSPYRHGFRVAAIYAAFSLCWILFSDNLVQWVTNNPHSLTLLQTLKGWMFVAVTALMLYVLVLRSHLRAEKVAQIDGLTGLLAHPAFKQLLIGMIARKTDNQLVAIKFLDINNFSLLNERIGYDQADKFLRSWADSLREECTTNCILGRFSADQFVLARVYEKGQSIEESVERLKLTFHQSQLSFGLNISCSIGVAIFPDDAKDAGSLLAAGVNAIQNAKQKKNSVFYHDKRLAAENDNRTQLFEDLQHAISYKELSLVYQPKYDLGTLQFTGMEILLRWNHAFRGFVPPSEFVALAEKNGISNRLTRYVVKSAVRELEQHGLLDRENVEVAMNVSAAEFNSRREMDSLLRLILDFPKLANKIKIEITETATLFNMAKSAEIISLFREAGIKVSIDDFGTGYTSLAMLKDFTIDEIKIDRSFVSELEQGGNAKTIVSAIIGMANSFDINVVAEGVETQEQLNALVSMGCRQAQGYFLGKPMGVAQLSSHIIKQVLRQDGGEVRALK